MRLELIQQLEEALKAENVLAQGRALSVSIREYKSLLSDEKYRGKSLDDELTDEELEEIRGRDKLDGQINALLSDYNEKRKVAQAKLADELKSNLLKKKEILREFEVLVKEEENIGGAFTKRKEIQERWAAIGRVPTDRFDSIQQEYSRLNDEFNYNINLYKAIKDHDLKRNYSLKNQVIFQMTELAKESSVKKVQEQLSVLMNQWDEIGPTFKEEWEKLKETYWEGVKQIRQQVNVFYEDKRKTLEDNLEVKVDLIAQAKEIASKKADSIKDWNETTNKLVELQNVWKKSGAVARDKNESIWLEFRAVFDEFFANKKIYFDSLKQESSAKADKKKKLIAKANELKESDQWKETTFEIVKLQKQWKDVGHAGKIDQKLWKDFRSVCDHFFNAKKAFFDSREDVEKENLAKKESLIKEIQEFTPSGDSSESVEKLKVFSLTFNEIGNVPFKVKDAVYKKYKAALDTHYDNLKVDKSKRDQIDYKSRLANLKGKSNADKLVKREKDDLQRKINKLKADVMQYENNLSFFGFSSGADAMIADVKKKINRSNKEIENLKSKIKILNQETKKAAEEVKEEE